MPTLEPRWRDIFIGHLHLLAQPSPTKILGCMVKGPTWYQTPAQQGQAWGPGSRCACKLHKGSAVWLWEGYLDQLPALGSAGDEGPTADYTRMLGGLQSSQVLIVHLPGSSKRFRGKYRLERGQPLEQNGERLIDNLQDHLEHLSFPINGIICIAGEVGMENGAPNREELRFQELISTRLRSLVPIFIISPNLPAAMDSLSGLLPDITPQTNLLWPANGDVVTEHGSVEIFDVGGALGYGLLADMHMDFPPGNQPNAMGRLMRRAMAALTRIFKTGARAQLPPLPYVHDGVRVSWSGSTLQGTSWAEQYRQGTAQRLSAVPWECKVQTSGQIQDLRFNYRGVEQLTASRPSMAMVTVGTDRDRGMRQLEQVLQWLRTVGNVPTLLIYTDESDTELMTWTRWILGQAKEALHDAQLPAIPVLSAAKMADSFPGA